MPQGFYMRLGWQGWLTLLFVLTLVIAVAAVVAILLVGAFIIVLPIVLIASLLYYLFPSLRYRHPNASREADVIEGEYRVVDPRQRDRDSLPRNEHDER